MQHSVLVRFWNSSDTKLIWKYSCVSARTRNGIAEIKRQRWLASQAAPVSSELLVLPYASGQFTTSPLAATQAIKPTGQISTPVRSNIVVVNQSQTQNTVTSKFKFYSLNPAHPRNHVLLLKYEIMAQERGERTCKDNRELFATECKHKLGIFFSLLYKTGSPVESQQSGEPEIQVMWYMPSNKNIFT